MSELTILGTCSGTEPVPGRHHTSWILKENDSLYWFDAGENCAYTAHTGQINLKRSRAIFLSHPHFDHVGGLPHLLWTLGKLRFDWHTFGEQPLTVYTPDVQQVRSFMDAMKTTEFGVEIQQTEVRQITDNFCYRDENITVEAWHNLHLGIPGDGQWKSFSFRIKTKENTVVYSGDIRSLDDLGTAPDGADFLLVETGHHAPAGICEGLKLKYKKPPKTLVFMHHSREVCKDPDSCRKKCSGIYPEKVVVAEDGDTFSC